MDVLGVGKRCRASGWVVRDVSLEVQRGELAVLRLDVPPVGHLLRQLSTTRAPPGLPLALIGDVVIASVLLAGSVATATYTSARRS